MSKKYLRTSDIARAISVHPNTIRLYETEKYFSDIPRAQNGYRQYSKMHLEQAKLIRLAIGGSYIGDKALLVDLIRSAAKNDFSMAMELAYQYLARVRMERTYAESALEFLERWATGQLMYSSQQKMHTSQAADYLNVTVDMLRNWERNGLIEVPRDPSNGYRVYSTLEFGRLRVIRTLVQSGYSLMAILRMLRQFDSGNTENLRDALELPPEDRANEAIDIIADRWLSGLVELEERAQAMIKQLSYMINLIHTRQNC